MRPPKSGWPTLALWAPTLSTGGNSSTPPIRRDLEDRAQAGSVVSLPNAPLSPQLSPHAAESPPNLEMHRFQSRLLGNERRVWLYRPPARLRPSSKPPRLLVVFDGQAYLTLIPTTAILEDLQSRGRLGPMYAVLVDSVSAVLRNKELLCDPALRPNSWSENCSRGSRSSSGIASRAEAVDDRRIESMGSGCVLRRVAKSGTVRQRRSQSASSPGRWRAKNRAG